MIYFIAAYPSDLIKIGYTAGDPLKRLKTLQIGSPESLVLLVVRHGEWADEHELHERFAHLRVRGEWFRHDRELLWEITKPSRVAILVDQSLSVVA